MTEGGWTPFKDKPGSGPLFLSRSNIPGRKILPEPRMVIGEEILGKSFPDAVHEEPFIEYAVRRLSGAHHFGVLMIQKDPVPEGEDLQAGDPAGLMKDLVEFLVPFCKEAGSGCGLYEPEILCGFLNSKSDAQCMEIGRVIQSRMADRRRETVTIGCSKYPMAHFSKLQVFENARKAVDHAVFFGPGGCAVFDAVSLNISGDNRYQEGDVSGAIREYQAALRIDPTNANVLNSMGVCFAALGDWDRAVETFETALWLDPEEVMTVHNLALVDQARGDQEKALKRYLEILDNRENHFETQFQVGRLYMEEKKLDEAESHLREAAALRPASGPANRYLGECCLATGKTAQAVAAFKRAIKINPNDAASLSALGHLFGEIGENPDVALAFCEQSVKISPEKGLFRYRLGNLYFRQGRVSDAEKAFAEALDLGYDAAAVLEKLQKIRLEKDQ